MNMHLKYFTAPLAETSKPHLILVQIQCGTHTLCVLLDTGAPTSVIKAHAVKRLNLHTHRKENAAPDDDGEDTEYATIPLLSLGDFTWTNLQPSVDHREDSSLLHHGRTLDGVFGCDLMNDLCWLFEPTRRQFHVCTPNHPFLKQWTQDAHHTTIHKHTLGSYAGNVWATQAFLNGQGPIHTDLDTGAQRTLLNTLSGAFLDPNTPREPIRLSNGGDITNVSSYRTQARTLTIAHVTFQDPLIAVCDPIFSIDPPLLKKPAILLGSDLLGQHRYGFDFLNGHFWIHPAENHSSTPQ